MSANKRICFSFCPKISRTNKTFFSCFDTNIHFHDDMWIFCSLTYVCVKIQHCSPPGSHRSLGMDLQPSLVYSTNTSAFHALVRPQSCVMVNDIPSFPDRGVYATITSPKLRGAGKKKKKIHRSCFNELLIIAWISQCVGILCGCRHTDIQANGCNRWFVLFFFFFC